MAYNADYLYTRVFSVMREDVKHIEREVQMGKLSPKSAHDLVCYVKLLKEVKEQQKRKLEEKKARRKAKEAPMSDAELLALAAVKPGTPAK